MVNKAKIKGSAWERDLVEKLNEIISNSDWKRIPSSGAMGTSLGEPLLTGDVKGVVHGFPKPFKAECKVGYGGDKQFTIKKEWLDKIKQEANNSYSIPFLAGKFSDARSGVKQFIVLDIDTFAYLLNLISEK